MVRGYGERRRQELKALQTIEFASRAYQLNVNRRKGAPPITAKLLMCEDKVHAGHDPEALKREADLVHAAHREVTEKIRAANR